MRLQDVLRCIEDRINKENKTCEFNSFHYLHELQPNEMVLRRSGLILHTGSVLTSVLKSYDAIDKNISCCIIHAKKPGCHRYSLVFLRDGRKKVLVRATLSFNYEEHSHVFEKTISQLKS